MSVSTGSHAREAGSYPQAAARVRLRLLLLLVLGGLAIPAAAQTAISLEQANARSAVDHLPQLRGREVLVRGTVTSRAIQFGEYAHVPIRNSRGVGLTLEAPDFMFERVAAGDQLEVRGTLGHRGGMVVLHPMQLTTTNHASVPTPPARRIQQLQSTQATGITAIIEGRVMALGEDTGGEYLLVDDGQQVPYPVYLPRAARVLSTGLGRYQVGDRVRATGMASQGPSEPPYQTKFRMVVPDASSVVLVERQWGMSPQLLLALLLGGGLVIGALLHYRHRGSSIRRSVRRIHSFCEELLTAANRDEVMRKMRTLAPRALEATQVEYHRFDRSTQSLRRTLNGGPEFGPVPVDGSISVTQGRDEAVALCFRNRIPLHVPDTRRSHLFRKAPRDSNPRAVVLLPAMAREELTGVLEIVQMDRPRYFPIEELMALQHLANQVAMVMKQQEQQFRKEQAMRNERLAATGQIMSGVTGELRQPLDSILVLAHRLMDQTGEVYARAILNESLRVSSILSRYHKVASREQEEAVPVEINGVLERVINQCRKEIAGYELQLEIALGPEPLWIVGSENQMEQVLTSLVLLAARSAKASLDHRLRIESSLSLKRVQVVVRYGALLCDEYFPQEEGSNAQPDGVGFGVCRGILHGLGGDVRILRSGEMACRLEIEMPPAFPAEAGSLSGSGAAVQNGDDGEPATHRTMTAMVLEPDPAEQRRLMSFWSAKGHRAIPIHNEAEAVEMLRRFRLDVVFCAVRIGGSNWVDFFDAVRDKVPVFVLLADVVDSDALTLFPQNEGMVLRKPVEVGELNRLIERVLRRLETCSSAST